MTTDFYTGPDGQPYKLDHLQTQRYEIKLKIVDQNYNVPVVLTFSKHCYTDDQNENGSPAQPVDPWFCLTDDKGHRVFCRSRWKASLTLPEYLHTIIDKGLDCYKANGGNFIRIHDNDRDEKYAGWYVFFAFSAANGRGPGIVRINISSHHHRRRLPDSVRSTVKHKFNSLLAQWFKDRPASLAQLKVAVSPEPSANDAGGNQSEMEKSRMSGILR